MAHFFTVALNYKDVSAAKNFKSLQIVLLT